MTKDLLIDYVSHGREIEFNYNGKMQSITYGIVDGKDVISFCEFYKDTTEVTTASDLWNNVYRDGVSVGEMLSSIKQDDIYIF